jgi:FlaA1/EpsC-like NDP-sugar epimerase
MKTILITGITGFFGRNFVDILIKKYNFNIIGTAHSETKLAHFKKVYPNIKIYLIDLSSTDFTTDFENILKLHSVNYIIHSAAMKHVDICQENPIMALRVNTIASSIILNLAKKYNIENMIALSTDKSNNPCNTYGMTKYIMQDYILEQNYYVYQGANFFWSDGSVLDIWFNQYIKNQPLSYRNNNYIRYFNTIDYICELIILNLDSKKKIIVPEYVYQIKLDLLLKCFTEYFNYHNIVEIPVHNYEKEIEILNEDVKNKIILNEEEIIKIIDTYYNNMK